MKKIICILLVLILNINIIFANQSNEILSIPLIYQRPELPNGCEITALAMAFNYYGERVSKTNLSDNYLLKRPFFSFKGKFYGANPFKAFAGNPRSRNGWFAYAQPIVDAANKYISEKKLDLKAENVSKKVPKDIIDEVNQGNVVLVWVTLGMGRANYIYNWNFEDSNVLQLVPTNLHCVVIKGVKNGKVFYADPIYGNRSINTDLFFRRYKELGSQAVSIKGGNGVIYENISNLGVEDLYQNAIYFKDGAYHKIKDISDLRFRVREVLVDIEIIANIIGGKVNKGEEIYEIEFPDQKKITFNTLDNRKVAIIDDENIKLSNETTKMEDKIYISFIEFSEKYKISIWEEE